MSIDPKYLKKTTTSSAPTANPLDYISKKKSATPENYQRAYSAPAPSYGGNTDSATKEATQMASSLAKSENERKGVLARAWKGYSSGVNEVLASANRGIGNTTTMFGNAVKFLGEYGTQKSKQINPESDGGLWKFYRKAGEWLEGAGGSMNEQLQTERSREIDRIFNEDPTGALKRGDFWLTKAPEQLVPSLAMLLPGAGVAGSVMGKAPTMLRILGGVTAGSGVSRSMESLSIAGDTYNQAKEQGATEEEAIEAGKQAFNGSLSLVGLDAVQLALAVTPLGKMLTGVKSPVARIVVETAEMALSGVTEGGEEVFQNYIQKKALGQDFDLTSNENKQAFILGVVGGLVFQAAGKVMTPKEKEEATKDYVDKIVEKLPPEAQAEFTPDMSLDEELASLEQLAEENESMVRDAARQIDEEYKQELYEARSSAEQEEAQTATTPDDIMAEIEAAAKVVESGSKVTVPELKSEETAQDVFADIPADVEEEAQTKWEETNAERYSEIERQVQDINKQLKTAKADEATRLQAEQKKLVDEQVKMEQDHIAEFQQKAKEKTKQKVADDVKAVIKETEQTAEVSSTGTEEVPLESVPKGIQEAIEKLAAAVHSEEDVNTDDELRMVVQYAKENGYKFGYTNKGTKYEAPVLRKPSIDTPSNSDNVNSNENTTPKPKTDDTRGGVRQSSDTVRDSESGQGQGDSGEPDSQPRKNVARGKRERGSSSAGERPSDSVRDSKLVKQIEKPKLHKEAFDALDEHGLKGGYVGQYGGNAEDTYYLTLIDNTDKGHGYIENFATYEDGVKRLNEIKEAYGDSKLNLSTEPTTEITYDLDSGEVSSKKTVQISESSQQKNVLAKALVDFVIQEGGSLQDQSLLVKKEIENFMPLTVERIGYGLTPDIVTIRHHYEQNGDIMFDPEVVFRLEEDGQLTPLSIETSPYGQKDIKASDPFLKMWANNLREQGFIENKKKPAKKKQPTQWEKNQDAIRALEADMRAVYLSTPAVDGMDGYNQADAVLNDILVQLDIAEAGYKVIFEHDATREGPAAIGVSSTFPHWIPDNARERDDLEYAIEAFADVRGFAFPRRNNETKRRDLANALFEEMDTQLGVDTSIIRRKILELYEETDTITEQHQETFQDDYARSAREAKGRTGYSQEELEQVINDTAFITAEGEVLFTNNREPKKDIKTAANSWEPAGGREGEGAEGRGLLDEYYTPPTAVNMVMSVLNWANAFNTEATKDSRFSTKVLEPTVGTGNFVYGLPKNVRVTGYEINPLSAKIAKMNHPEARIFSMPFEELFIDKRGNKKMPPERYDIVVGNPPYGSHRGLYKGLGEEEKIQRYETYFIKRALDITREGGYVAMVVPSSFVRSGNKESGKEDIAKTGELVAALRLPNGAFETTDIGTDILVFKKHSGTDETIRGERLKKMSNDRYFIDNPLYVLGETKTVRGKYGEEEKVTGTLDNAYELFQATPFFVSEEVKTEEEITKDINEFFDNLDTQLEKRIGDLQSAKNEELSQMTPTEAVVTEQERRINERRAEDSAEQSTLLEAAGLKAGDKVQRFVHTGDVGSTKETGKLVRQDGSSFMFVETKTGTELWNENWFAFTDDIETTSQGGVLDLSTLDGDDIADQQWQYVSATGELEGDFDPTKAYYMKGKYYNKFNYLQGNIYQKLKWLQEDYAAINNKEKYEEQKALLEAVLPEPMTVDRMRIPPYAHFTVTTTLTNGQTLQENFLKWIETLPMSAFGMSSRHAVKGYVEGWPVRGGDKLQNEQERRTRRIEGDRLFKLYMTEELSQADKGIVEDNFNSQFNAYHRPDYQNVPLVSKLSATFKGRPLQIREVQRQGVGFLLNKGVGLLAHDVGLGKTMQGIIANIELLERGWAKRPLIVLPSVSVYRQWISEIKHLKPDIKINELANLGGDFKGDLATLSIPNGTLSLITEEGFKKLGFSDETYAELTSDLNDVIENPNERKTKRQGEKNKAKTEETIGKGMRGTSSERNFEDLGFDAITVDEVHNYNHIISSAKTADDKKVTEFRGFSQTPSISGIKLWLAAQYIQKNNNGRNVIGLSATPFTNHPLEYYSILSLFARNRLTQMGIRNVNDFMSMYMDIVAKDEVKADGSLASKLDVRGFNNAQQFQALLREFIDFRDGEEAGIVRPERQSREYIVEENRMSYDYKLQAQELFEEKEAGTLRAMTELQKIAFSPFISRYHDGPVPTAKQFVEGSPKIKLATELIAETYRNVPDSNSIIYSSRGKEYLPLIKQYLVEEKGFKPEEIELITGSTAKPKRTTIQNDFNAGKVRVIIGNEAIEEGINLQEKTTDLYILSQPWNFTAVRQVIGRAWRQGNQWKNVRINQLFTENTFDIFLAQTIEKKRVRYQEAQRRGADYIDAGDVEYEDLKTDLMTDPEMKVRVQFNERRQKIEAEIKREEADFAQKNRKNKKFVDALGEVRQWRDRLVMNPEGTWVMGVLRSKEEEVVRLRKELSDRGIDIKAIDADLAESEAKITALKTERDTMKDAEEKALQAARIEREQAFQVFTDTDYSRYVKERVEDDERLFLGDEPMFSLVPTDDVTLATLEAIKDEVKKEFISTETLNNFLSRPAVKQIEKDTIRSAAEQIVDNGEINVAKLVETVQAELLFLDFIEHDPDDMYDGPGGAYESITLPDNERGPVYNYNERVYQSPIKTSAGQVHSGLPRSDRYFGHTRYEDMADGFAEDGVTPGYGTSGTRRVIEVQSDLFQKGRLEKETDIWSQMTGNDSLQKIHEREGRPIAEIEAELLAKGEEARRQLSPYRNVWWEYLLRKEIKQASADGMSYLQLPTGKTAMKIEGLGDSTRWYIPRGAEINGGKKAEVSDLEVGQELTHNTTGNWVVTKVLGDGKFEAVERMYVTPESNGQYVVYRNSEPEVAYKTEKEAEDWIKMVYENGNYSETFDISGKVDETNPIFKFYERQVGKYLQNNYNAMRVTDERGVEWWQVRITPDMAQRPVYAFRAVPIRDKEGKFVKWVSQAEWNRTHGYVFGANIRDLTEALKLDVATGEITREEARKESYIQRYTASAITPEQAITQLENYKKRFKLDFPVEVVDRIFVQGEKVRDKILAETEAYAAMYNSTIFLTGDVGRTTAHHEFVHEILANIEKIPEFTGMTRKSILTAINNGQSPTKLNADHVKLYNSYLKDGMAETDARKKALAAQDRNLEEQVAYGYEKYLAEKSYQNKYENGILERFYRILKDMTLAIQRVFGGGKGSEVAKFYDMLATGEASPDRPVIALWSNPVRTSYVRMQTSEGLQYLDFGKLKADKEDYDRAARAALFQAVQTDDEVMTNKVFQNENRLNFIMKDINTIEDITAQAHDIYLKDPEQFAQANTVEMIGEAHDADKNKLDQFFSEQLQPYMTLKAEKREKVNKMLWDGDDMGKNFTEAELVYMLDTEQIAAYKAVRKAMETAHEMLLREMAKKGVDPVEIEAYRQERTGYMPHKWIPKLGKFQTLKSWVKSPETYVVKWQHKIPEGRGYETFDMHAFASEKEALAYQAEMQAKNEDPTIRFAVDKLTSLEVDFFSGLELTQEKMSVVIENMREEGFVKDHIAQMLRDNLSDMFKEKGFGRHYLRRTGVRGFDTTNTERILAQYFSGFSGYITKMRWSTDYFTALSQVDARRQPQFFNWLKDLIAYKLNNKAEWRLARTLSFAWYLANDLSYLATNATQNWTVGMGELSKHVEGADKAWKPEAYILKATNDWALKVNLTPDERAAIDGLLEKGQLGAEMTSELMGFKNNPLYNEISSTFNKVMYASTAIVEKNINRIPMFLAARRIFVEQGMSPEVANNKALEVSNDVHFRYGRHHRPRMMRGRVNVLFVFQHYIRTLLYQLYRDAKHREFVSLTRKMMYTVALGGVTALPFAKLLIMIFEDIAGVEDDDELKEEVSMWKIIIERGLPAGLLDIDLSDRVGIEMLSVNKIWEEPADVRTYLGAIGDLLFKKPFDTMALISQERYSEALGKGLPDMFANPVRAYNGYRYGVYSINGNPLIDHNGDIYKYNTWEAIVRAAGYTPTTESMLWDEKAREWKRDDQNKEIRANEGKKIKGMIARGELDEARALQEQLRADGVIDEDTDYIRQVAGDIFFEKAYSEWTSGAETKSRLTAIENKLIEDLYNGTATDRQRNNVRKELATYRQYGMDNEYVGEIMKLSTNEDKVNYLVSLRDELGEDAFKEFYAKGRTKITTEAGSRVPIFFSDDLTKLLEDEIKRQNATQN